MTNITSPKVTKLTPTRKLHVREALADFCARAEANRLQWSYTQQRPFRGFGVPPEARHAADCSGYVSLAFNWAMHEAGVYMADPLGERYNGYGYTGTLLAFLKAHHAPADKYQVGDIAIFGTPTLTEHTSVCRKAGTAKTSVFSSNGHQGWSFGSDAPNPISLADEKAAQSLVGVFRHPSLL